MEQVEGVAALRTNYWVVGKLVCHGTVNALEITGSSPVFPAKNNSLLRWTHWPARK